MLIVHTNLWLSAHDSNDTIGWFHSSFITNDDRTDSNDTIESLTLRSHWSFLSLNNIKNSFTFYKIQTLNELIQTDHWLVVHNERWPNCFKWYNRITLSSFEMNDLIHVFNFELYERKKYRLHPTTASHLLIGGIWVELN